MITSDTGSGGSDLSLHSSITGFSLTRNCFLTLPPPPTHTHTHTHTHTQVFNVALNGNILVGNAVIMD